MRVAIAEDSVLLREGLSRLLTDGGFDVVGRWDNAEDLLARVRVDPPDVVILDIRLPPTHSDEGMRAALHIRQRHPLVGVLVVMIADDGVGGADTERGTGLRGLADRVEALDGRLRVWTPLGGGTHVRAEIPCG